MASLSGDLRQHQALERVRDDLLELALPRRASAHRDPAARVRQVWLGRERERRVEHALVLAASDREVPV
jgi:hypothetical protein